MMQHFVLRELPAGLTIGFQPIPAEAADASIMMPPRPTPPVVVLRAAVTFDRHPMWQFKIELVLGERVGRGHEGLLSNPSNFARDWLLGTDHRSCDSRCRSSQHFLHVPNRPRLRNLTPAPIAKERHWFVKTLESNGRLRFPPVTTNPKAT